jgi:DNA-binding CsgD family transcriptional regulator|tara:strand:- start:574 stop:744 length:171 start_codon:yes stop_codon:yes gene_type:complete
MNYNSETKKYSQVVNEDTINKREVAIKLRLSGMDVKEISQLLKVSQNRVYQYLRRS